MDTTRKIPQRDIELLREFQMGLAKRAVKVSQKELIDKALHFSLSQEREKFIASLQEKQTNEEARFRWIHKKNRIKADLLEEHDTVL